VSQEDSSNGVVCIRGKRHLLLIIIKKQTAFVVLLTLFAKRGFRDLPL